MSTAPIWISLMLAVSLWILLASPGPLLFRQERIGYRGNRFTLFKFRSMHVNADTSKHERYLQGLIQSNQPMTKLDAGDERVFKGGHALRAFGLDELPQIFNVLRGEMSLVGPRPCTPSEFAQYTEPQKERINFPPGLTGLWQANGKNKTTFDQMVAMDIAYGRSMALRSDLGILLKTYPAVVLQFLESRFGLNPTFFRQAFPRATGSTQPNSRPQETDSGRQLMGQL